MPTRFRLVLVVLGLIFLVSCSSSSKSENDADALPDADAGTQDSETQDDDSDSQNPEIVDDSDKVLGSDLPDPGEEIFEKTEPINGYKRCYDKIPAGQYEGFFADPNLEYWVKRSLNYDEDYELTEEDLLKVTKVSVYSQDIRGIEKLANLESVKISGGNVYDYIPLLWLENFP